MIAKGKRFIYQPRSNVLLVRLLVSLPENLGNVYFMNLMADESKNFNYIYSKGDLHWGTQNNKITEVTYSCVWEGEDLCFDNDLTDIRLEFSDKCVFKSVKVSGKRWGDA